MPATVPQPPGNNSIPWHLFPLLSPTAGAGKLEGEGGGEGDKTLCTGSSAGKRQRGCRFIVPLHDPTVRGPASSLWARWHGCVPSPPAKPPSYTWHLHRHELSAAVHSQGRHLHAAIEESRDSTSVGSKWSFIASASRAERECSSW